MKSLTIFGLQKCSTCQKAKDGLEEAGWQVALRDVRDAPLSEDERERMVAEFGEKIINRASLTWRAMSDEDKALPPAEMMRRFPSVMKRPAIVAGDQRYLGWTANVKRGLGAA